MHLMAFSKSIQTLSSFPGDSLASAPAGVILDMIVGSSLGTLVKGVSGIGCFCFSPFLFLGNNLCEKASLTILAVVSEILRVSPSGESKSLGSQ